MAADGNAAVTEGNGVATDAYGIAARWYDLATESVMRAVRERLLARISNAGIRRILDIGCGTGVFTAMLAQRGLEAIGVDVSPAMLAEAKKRVPRDRLVLADDLPLPFERFSFEASVLCLVMHESASGADALLAEALRVAPLCYVVEWRMPERNLDLLARPLVHGIERLAGKEHYASFRRFAGGGYLQGATRRLGAEVKREEMMKAGTLVLAEISAKS